MKFYNIIKEGQKEDKEYAFEELKGKFKPVRNEREDISEFWILQSVWEDIRDIDSLKDFLQSEDVTDGVSYDFAEVEAPKRSGKYYKDFEMIPIGGSDIACLIMAGCHQEEGFTTDVLHFGGDGSYWAYLVDEEDVVIGAHYDKVGVYHHWMKLYDDTGRVFFEYGKEFRIYRAGDYGCIIQMIQ